VSYKYQVVRGCGLYGVPRSIFACKKYLKGHNTDLPYIDPENRFEIERILVLSNGAKRYWRMRNGKWVTKFDYTCPEADAKRWQVQP